MRSQGRCRAALTFLIGCSTASAAWAQALQVSIDAGRASEPVSKYEYGMFIEPIGPLVARSLWAEMLDDRKFYYPIQPAPKDAPAPQTVEGRPGVMPRRWRPIGGDDAVVTDSQDPYVGAHSASVTVHGSVARGFGQAGIGIAKGQTYTGHLLLSGDPGVRVEVALIWGDASDQRQVVTLPALTSAWQSVAFRFTPDAGTDNARFAGRREALGPHELARIAELLVQALHEPDVRLQIIRRPIRNRPVALAPRGVHHQHELHLVGSSCQRLPAFHLSVGARGEFSTSLGPSQAHRACRLRCPQSFSGPIYEAQGCLGGD